MRRDLGFVRTIEMAVLFLFAPEYKRITTVRIVQGTVEAATKAPTLPSPPYKWLRCSETH